jgi:hypothetical protein
MVLTLTLMILFQSPAEAQVRIATYNASLYGKASGQTRQRLANGMDRQAEQIAAIVQTVRPDVLLINEIDYDSDGETARLLSEKFFARSQGEREPIEYPYIYAVRSNTGIDSELDLNNNDRRGEPNDAWGYGVYPGQYSMAIFSRLPIVRDEIRTFQQFLWKDLPAALRPIDPASKQPYYDDDVWNRLRLSSKNHVDLPVLYGNHKLHLLASHPTPPVFDGAEDRNGCRNHDEIRFWIDYLAGEESAHLVDDMGSRGGLPKQASFVILGDLNSDPNAGDSRREAIQSLLAHERVQDVKPESKGAIEAAQRRQRSEHARHDTASFGAGRNMRVDYVLPSRALTIQESGVFWPAGGGEDRQWISASDHRMVWIEVEIR